MKHLISEEVKKNENIKSVKFYYHKNPLLENVCTSCLIISNNEKIISRGVAICSVLDNHKKSIGRKISFNRAMEALFKKTNSKEIKPFSSKNYNKIIKKQIKVKTNSEKFNDIELNAKVIGNYMFKKIDEKTNLFVIPLKYNNPILIASTKYRYKSEYLPEPTEEEKRMFKFL